MKLVANLVLLLASMANPALADGSPEMAQIAGRYLAKASHGALDSFFRDYPSARFRKAYPHIYEAEPGRQFWYLCGEVNAKSAAGGYTGWEPFLITPEAGNRIAVWSGIGGPADAGTNVQMQVSLCARPELGGAKNTVYQQHDFSPELSFRH